MTGRIHKKIILHAVYAWMVLSVCFFNACDPKKNEDPKKVAEQHNDAKFNNKPQESDAQFLTDAAAMCLQQIKLAKLAQQNSIRPEIQEKGKIFEAEYAKIYKSVMYLASIKTVTLPSDLSDDQKKIYNDLGFEISKDFDKKYIDQVIKDHNAVIAEYQQVQKETKDEEIRSFITKTLPVFAGNLNLISTYKQQ